MNPKVILVLSGKRKSGKDHIAQILIKKFGNDCVDFRIAGPIKAMFAQMNGIDFNRLLDSSPYKESYRAEMVRWSEEIRREDPNCFLRQAILDSQATNYPVWLLTDARRMVDIKFFKEHPSYASKTVLIRIRASEATRTRRGWVFTPGVDDKETECGLDECNQWDFVIENNDGEEGLLPRLEPLIAQVQKALLQSSV